MEIREANSDDIPGILKVLKRSLGETSSQKTEAIWRYKHIDNPFGKSLVLIAIQNEIIIGVRAFMRWNWQLGDKNFTAFRAVDTATDPDHQGKGIFKKLTLKAIEIGAQNGDNFVFNTPNDQSRPGYLKMGWEIVGKVYVNIKPVIPFSRGNEIEVNKNSEISNQVLLETKDTNAGKKMLFTPKDHNYLSWRYKNCLLQEYLIYETNEVFVAGYLKKHKYFNELRISEFISNGNNKLAKSQILNWAQDNKATIITSSKKIFRLGVSKNIGPILTLKDLNLDKLDKEFCLNIGNWNNSLGDLELF